MKILFYKTLQFSVTNFLGFQEDKNQILRRLFLQKNIDITNSVKLGAGRYSKVITARQYQNMESGVYKKVLYSIFYNI